MNKYQRKINKLTQDTISKDMDDFYKRNFPNTTPRQCGKTNMLKSLMEQAKTLSSKSYYRWVRKNIRSSLKTNILIFQ